MGKRIRVRRRGKAGSVFRSLRHKKISPSTYPLIDKIRSDSMVSGIVKNLIHEPSRGAPLALITFNSLGNFYLPPPEGLGLGEQIIIGENASPQIGNILMVGNIPEGTMVCNVELEPGDGGKIARSSGTFCSVVAHIPAGTEIKLPSGKSVYLNNRCRATIGVIAGSGRLERPMLKSGKNYHKMKVKSGTWPLVSGKAMNVVSHPFGGGRHKHAGKPTTVSRNAPPGRKVGLIAAKRSGRKKR